MKQIIKRDGRIVEYDPIKITNAIWKAAKAVGGADFERAVYLTRVIGAALDSKYSDGVATVEQIQDQVEKTLVKSGHYKTSKAYILYRKQHEQNRETAALIQINNDVIEKYVSQNDWRINENANMTFSMQGMNFHISGRLVEDYWLHRIYPDPIRHAHEDGDIHIHDTSVLGAYCVGWNLQDLLITGFRGVKGKAASKPPKHFRAALGQIVNYLFTLQGEAAGAQAFSNFDTLMAPFIYYDDLNYKQVKQGLQEFVFNMNVPTRTGFQTPFTNVTLDLKVPEFMKNEPVVIGGQLMEETYGDFQDEMDIFNRAFAEIMMEGDADERVFTFPIPTYNITEDFDWNNPEYDVIWEMTAKYGIPYFSNFIGSDMNPEDARSMCCRLRLDNRELQKRGGGLFGANPLTGCYDDQTEIFTQDGWKLFKDLSVEDKVFTLTANNKIELHQPKRLFAYDYDGEMIAFKSKGLDLLVTPNHRMLVDQGDQRKFVLAENFNGNIHRIPKKAIWEGQEEEFYVLPGIEFVKYGGGGSVAYKNYRDDRYINMDDWLAFLGIWLAEGSFDNDKNAQSHGYRVFITQIKETTRSEIESLLKRLPFNYRVSSNGFYICNKQLWSYVRQLGKQKSRFIPSEIKNLSPRQLKVLFDWMLKGDGHVRPSTGQINYWTCSRQLADDVQEIIIKMGHAANISKREGSIGSINGHMATFSTTYCIGVQKTNHHRLRNRNISRQYYKGKVYCCEVTNNSVLVRRNDKAVWCGNSIGVVTINMPRLGQVSANREDYFLRLGLLMDLAKDSLEIKRKVIENFTEIGLYPYSKFYLRSVKQKTDAYWENHFSTIGLIGMNEACLNLLGVGITDLKGYEFSQEVLDFMRDRIAGYQETTGHLFNLEATPAEGCSYKLLLKDKKKFGEYDYPYYTNSTALPVGYTDDLYKALRHQDTLQTKYTGGTVFHIFLGESAPSGESARKLVKKICEGYSMPYFTLSPTFSVCDEHGYLRGEQKTCPICAAEGKDSVCEVYSRIVGYLRPIDQWNEGKKLESIDRRKYDSAL